MRNRSRSLWKFRVVADGNRWAVHTAVKPERGLEVEFVVEPLVVRSREMLREREAMIDVPVRDSDDYRPFSERLADAAYKLVPPLSGRVFYWQAAWSEWRCARKGNDFYSRKARRWAR